MLLVYPEDGGVPRVVYTAYTERCIPTRVLLLHIQGGVYPPGCLSGREKGRLYTHQGASQVGRIGGIYPPGCVSGREKRENIPTRVPLR